MTNQPTELATLAGGCFWCIEVPFEQLAGVASVTSGYAGGDTENPTYEEVCTGETGHTEVVQIRYDPDEIAYEDLLRVFFTLHDPTQLNRQGPDVGTQYRSAIYYHDEEQREAAERVIAEFEESGTFDDDIVTEVSPLDTFYEAEEYHQNYFEKNPDDAYCTVHINPKLKKLRESFADKLAQ